MPLASRTISLPPTLASASIILRGGLGATQRMLDARAKRAQTCVISLRVRAAPCQPAPPSPRAAAATYAAAPLPHLPCKSPERHKNIWQRHKKGAKIECSNANSGVLALSRTVLELFIFLRDLKSKSIKFARQNRARTHAATRITVSGTLTSASPFPFFFPPSDSLVTLQNCA